MPLPPYVAATMAMLETNPRQDVVDIDHATALQEMTGRDMLRAAWTTARELDHAPNPTEGGTWCRLCNRRIHARYDSHGGFESAAHLDNG